MSISSRPLAWMIWLIASIFYAYQYVLRVIPNVMLTDIMQNFQMDTTIFGQFSGIYYIGYSLMHLPIGILLDRFGPRRVMSVCMLLTVVGLLPIILSDHWVYPVIGRLITGIGSSAAILGAFKIIRMGFEEAKFSRMLSFLVTIGLIGAIYGGAPVNALCQTLGYTSVIKIFAGVGVFLALATYWIVPEMERPPQTPVFHQVRLVLSNHKVLFCCLFAGLMVGPLEGFADVWSAVFLKQAYGLDTQLSSSLPSLIFIGMCFGAPCLTFIAEKTENYLATIIGSGLVMALSFVALLAGYLTLNIMSISFFLIGVCCAYQILAIYKASTYVHEDAAGLTTALANMIIMSFGYFFHSLIGIAIRIAGGPETPGAFVWGLSVIPMTLLIGSLGFIFLQWTDTRTREV